MDEKIAPLNSAMQSPLPTMTDDDTALQKPLYYRYIASSGNKTLFSCSGGFYFSNGKPPLVAFFAGQYI